MTDEPRRLHVATAVAEALKGLRDLALPILVGLVFGGSRSSFSALLFGAGGIVLALVIGVARWRAATYRVTPTALHFRSGVFSPDDTVVPLERIQAVDTIAGPVERVFGVTGLHVQTPGGSEDGDVVLGALSSRAAGELRAALGHPDTGLGGPRRRLSLGGLFLAALTGPQLTVVLPLVGGAFGLLQNGFMGEGESAIKNINSVQDVVLVVVVLVGAALVLSFLGAVVAFAGFEVERADDRLRIRRGLLQRRAVSVPVARIDGIHVAASPLRRPFGLAGLRLEVTGLAGRESVARTLFPLLPAREVEAFLNTMIPELAGPLDVDLRPPPRARRRYVTVPLTAALLASALIIILIPAAWPAAPVLLVVAVLAGLDAHALGGVRLAEGDPRVVLRARHRGSRVTLVARRRRLQRLAVSRNPLQRRAGLATVSITIARGTRLGVKHLERPLAARVVGELAP